jgi:hypothetical protein
MKTKIFKFVLPALFVALGLIGAFTSHAMDKKATDGGAVWGYKQIGGVHPCQQVQLCDGSPNFVCKSSIDNSPLFALTAPDQCPTMLFRSTP